MSQPCRQAAVLPSAGLFVPTTLYSTCDHKQLHQPRLFFWHIRACLHWTGPCANTGFLIAMNHLLLLCQAWRMLSTVSSSLLATCLLMTSKCASQTVCWCLRMAQNCQPTSHSSPCTPRNWEGCWLWQSMPTKAARACRSAVVQPHVFASTACSTFFTAHQLVCSAVSHWLTLFQCTGLS